MAIYTNSPSYRQAEPGEYLQIKAMSNVVAAMSFVSTETQFKLAAQRSLHADYKVIECVDSHNKPGEAPCMKNFLKKPATQ